MQISLSTRVFLAVSGLIGIAIGGALLFTPVEFQASSGINLADDVNLLSEIRAPGGALLAAGIIIVSGAFVQKITQTSILLSCLFYLSYGASRLVGVMIDGVPGNAVVAATACEIIIGLMSLCALLRFHKKQNRPT
ncbi:MAG: DUF4345 domain-containing protein [Rhodospirillaceae bacterium]|jgi:hypothetical protein|nr:DUF4345 domain-containing protein [Rhodospirillaceae bacterium]MBT5243499.1 DUF4345 domain-containing protein [Rhodospirillaceae bacterium]MBT5562087.1 DUF4345 domain-containing protein [Rhodospirillaceae bacterium]MBT6242260.1 DUF4345 domain-containing protein [Rhodospirillaceae bacterium]MBT7136916.1 DUF4345 domain-containing protein [Rhodospirillaceae bacterium]